MRVCGEPMFAGMMRLVSAARVAARAGPGDIPYRTRWYI